MSATETKQETIEITIGQDLARQITAAEAAGKRPVLVHDGVRYLLDPVEAKAAAAEQRDIRADYDPAEARAGMLAAAGSITPEEADEAIANIYRWRNEGSRPWNEPK
ncbi:MAG: hypothetical protein ACR2LS_05565 [Thermomicrobiales bacterium]